MRVTSHRAATGTGPSADRPRRSPSHGGRCRRGHRDGPGAATETVTVTAAWSRPAGGPRPRPGQIIVQSPKFGPKRAHWQAITVTSRSSNESVSSRAARRVAGAGAGAGSP